MIQMMLDKILGEPIRRIATQDKTLFLTFDDGPDEKTTERVLDVLDAFGAKATFFVIAEQVRKHPALVREILKRRHSIGNHSLDHRFIKYFATRNSTLSWVMDSEKIISDVIGGSTVGFRPPWGVRTPPLAQALKQLHMPLILWNTRFYDAVTAWTADRAQESIANAKSGAIVLLHDRQSEQRRESFLQTLHGYVALAKKEGFDLRKLSRAELI